ncbi:MAG: histidine phosphatase family protein [Desulfobacterales bacterium]
MFSDTARHCRALKNGLSVTDIPLSEKGIQQALNWRRAFEHISFDRICSSDLIRSHETAQRICPDREIELFPQLREINLGEWEGLAMSEVRARFPEAWAARGGDMSGYRPPRGESFADLSQRVLPVFENIALNSQEKNILIVSHAGVNRVILCHILGMPLARLFSIDQEYGALNIIHCEENLWKVSGMNLQLQSEIDNSLKLMDSCLRSNAAERK